MPVEYKTLGQIIVDVRHAREWFERNGVPTAGTRIDEIDRYLQELLNPTEPEANPFGADPRGAEAYHALSDAAGFGRIATGLSAIPSHLLPRGALRDSLRGPLALSAESVGGTADARNKFVELELAAHCSLAGLEVFGFDDVVFGFEGCRYMVECKRPSRRHTINENIENAYDQLRDRLQDGDRGLVAIAVDKAFGLDGRFHQARTIEDFSRLGVSIANELREMVSPYERKWLDTRIVGIVAIIRFLVKANASDLVAQSYQIGVIKLASEHRGQSVDSLRLDRMATSLRGSSPAGR